MIFNLDKLVYIIQFLGWVGKDCKVWFLGWASLNCIVFQGAQACAV